MPEYRLSVTRIFPYKHKIFDTENCSFVVVSFGTKYSRMDLVKIVEDSL